MSYSTLPAPSDIFGANSSLRSRVFPIAGDHRRDESHSPTSEPRSPPFRPSLPAELPPHLVSLYSSPYAAAAVAAAVAGQGSGGHNPAAPFPHFARVPTSPVFYPGMVGGDAWRRSPYLSQLDMYWPGLRSLEAVVGPRTKAPREATSILKSWLNEHKDNPYPTKSEKMTLSIVTHMTLTQVSTWFANARRRIKKENKMTWTPKTRCGERDDNSSNEEESDKDYYGRQRSPFPMSRESTESSISSYDSQRRPQFPGQSQPSLVTSPKSTELSRNNTAPHPLFAAFNGLTAPYRKSEPVHTDAKTPDKRLFHVNSATSRSSPTTDNAEKVHKDSVESFKAVTANNSSSDDERKDVMRSPFINLGKRRSSSTDFHETVKKSRVNEPPSSPINHERYQRHELSEPERFHSLPDGTPPIPMPMNINNTGGNIGAIGSWIKNIRNLVATGQEDKLTQALAAFAAAAKTGAYPDLGVPTFSPFQCIRQSNTFESSAPNYVRDRSRSNQNGCITNRKDSSRCFAIDPMRNHHKYEMASSESSDNEISSPEQKKTDSTKKAFQSHLTTSCTEIMSDKIATPPAKSKRPDNTARSESASDVCNDA